MFDYLLNHAYKNAWCSPRQDLQAILQPARISPPLGIHGATPHMWGSLALPTPKDQYHLYQIGQIHPSLLGLFPQPKTWMNLSTMMGVENLMADVYVADGRQLARFETWLLLTESRDVLVAVKDQPRIASLKTEPLFLRLYSNAYFASDRADSVVNRIECKGMRVGDPNLSLLFQRDYHNSQLRPGYTTLFVNGVYVHDFLPPNLVAGDIVEYVYDSTVKAVIDLKIADLDTFDSILDSKRKYLVHYPEAQVDGPVIDYRDDIDLYLINLQQQNGMPVWDGAYYHKNQNDAFRMVTHRDYTIAVPYVIGYLLSRPNWTDVQLLTLRMIVRRSGWQRSLINEHHRIKELYKLQETDRSQALLGIDSSVAVWQAAELENSNYTKLMDALTEGVTPSVVQSAYGYNAISKLVADSPLPVEVVSGRRQVSLPYALQANSTIYEYDAEGKLLEFHYHTLGAEYTPFNSQTQLIEGIMGRGSFSLSTVFGQQNVELDPEANYRYYIAPIQSGVVQHDQWTDVTGDATKYMVIGTTATWLVDTNLFAVAVKSDRDFLAYDLTLSPNNGLLKFSIDAEATYPSGAAQGVMYIPFGNLDLWLNKRALIEGLDYYIAWPQVIIVNKAYLVPGDTQQIHVRGTGFCNSDMTMPEPQEVGFIRYGLLSRNSRFDVRDDKVLRIVADGRTFHRSVLKFAEDDSGVEITAVPNGKPYVIEEPVIPLRGLVDGETPYTLRDKSKVVDQAISDYLSLRLPEPVKTSPDYIPDKYAVYSPFASTVAYDLLNGIIPMTDFKGQYSDMDVRDALASYTYLLDYDPTQKIVDDDHVAIHPTNLITEMVLDIYQYNFLARAIKTFLDDKVDITQFVSIKPTWI